MVVSSRHRTMTPNSPFSRHWRHFQLLPVKARFFFDFHGRAGQSWSKKYENSVWMLLFIGHHGYDGSGFIKPSTVFLPSQRFDVVCLGRESGKEREPTMIYSVYSKSPFRLFGINNLWLPLSRRLLLREVLPSTPLYLSSEKPRASHTTARFHLSKRKTWNSGAWAKYFTDSSRSFDSTLNTQQIKIDMQNRSDVRFHAFLMNFRCGGTRTPKGG